MADTVKYGMGQYRYTSSFTYISEMLKADKENNSNFINYYTNTSTNSQYQDIVINLPSFNDTPLVQYGETYYVRLTIPQNYEYTTTLDLKLCPYNFSRNEIDIERYQYIKRLIIPPVPSGGDLYSDVLLYEVPNQNSNSEKIAAAVIDDAHDYYDNPPILKTYNSGEVYKETDTDSSSELGYKYVYGIGNDQAIEITKNSLYKLLKAWVLKDKNDVTITYEFAFSPRYNLSEGYSFLFLETNRENPWSQNIQYIGEDEQTYFGTFIDKSAVKIELYKVANLLEHSNTGYGQIQSGSNTLNHIGVWGHPEQILTINGEEIRIGQSGFYELDNFEISSLGVVVYDQTVDRFTIDYEYKINT